MSNPRSTNWKTFGSLQSAFFRAQARHLLLHWTTLAEFPPYRTESAEFSPHLLLGLSVCLLFDRYALLCSRRLGALPGPAPFSVWVPSAPRPSLRRLLTPLLHRLRLLLVLLPGALWSSTSRLSCWPRLFLLLALTSLASFLRSWRGGRCLCSIIYSHSLLGFFFFFGE